MGRIAITGATGFIGGRIARALIARGEALRSLERQPNPRRQPAGDFEVVRGGLNDHTALRRLVDGCDAVIHAAAIASRGQPAPRYAAVNAEGTRDLCRFAAAAGARRFIFLSSVAATETRPDPYAKSKAVAEAYVLAQPELDATLLRLDLVYGPGSPNPLMRALPPLGRLPLIPAPARTRRFRPIHVDDGVACVLASLDRPESAGRTLAVGGPDALDLGELIRRGAGRPLLPLPSRWVRGLLSTVALPATASLRNIIETEGGPPDYDIEEMRAALGVTPRPYPS